MVFLWVRNYRLVEADSFTVVVEAEVIMISEHVGLQDKQSV